jgi:hypothetical protein
MELVDRYLQAVKFWLPRKEKDDIIAELSEDLRSQIEEKEAELGHQLTADEVEPILKRCGSPIAVAERYLPQRSLIGPALFPIYSMVLKSLFLYFLLPWFLLWLGIAIFSPDFQADHPGIGILGSLEPWWLACTHAIFFNTVAFWLLDRSQVRSQLVNTWNLRSLPIVREPNQISRGSTICEITFSVATLALWIQLRGYERVFHVFGLTIKFAHTWPYIIWALTALSGLGIAVACLNLTKRRWTRAGATFRLGIDIYSWGLVYWICKANLLQSLSASNLPPSDAAALVQAINHWTSISAIWVLLIGAIVVAFDVRRILRVGPGA